MARTVFPRIKSKGVCPPGAWECHQRGSPKEGSVPASRARCPRPVGTRRSQKCPSGCRWKSSTRAQLHLLPMWPCPQAKDANDAFERFRKLQEWSYFAAGEHDTKFQFPRLQIKFYRDTPRALVCRMSTVHGGFHAVKWLGAHQAPHRKVPACGWGPGKDLLSVLWAPGRNPGEHCP